MPLTNPKHERFVAEYLIDNNGKQAAIRAGYSPKSATAQASRLLTYADVREAIDAGRVQGQRQAEMSAIEVLRELAALASSNVEHYCMGADGRIALAPGAPPFAMRCVSSVKMKRRTITAGEGPSVVEHDLEFRLWSKDRALENLGKHFGLLTEHYEVNITQELLMKIVHMSDMELSAFIAAMADNKPKEALKLIQGGQAG